MRRITGMAEAVAVLAALAAACGGSGAQSSASSLQGTVHTAAGTAAPGILATVAGSNLSATTDDSGNFSIDGAPEGPATVHLKGSGVDASVGVPRLGKNMVVHVRIRIRDDGKGELEDEPEAEIRGPITAISGSDLTVAGLTVHTDAQTAFRVGGSLAALKAGQIVEVEGTQQADGSVLAREVKTEDGAGENEGELELTGKVESRSGTDLTVAGRLIHTDAQTVVDGKGASKLDDIKVGMNVEVHAVSQSDGSALARRIHVED